MSSKCSPQFMFISLTFCYLVKYLFNETTRNLVCDNSHAKLFPYTC